MQRIRLTGLVLALITLASTCHAARTQWTRQLADGVTLTQILQTCDKDQADCKPLWINVITADPKKPGVAVRTVLAQDMVMNDDPTKGRETVSSMVKRTGALAGTNGDYHNWEGTPANLFILDGELVSSPWSRRPCFAIKDDGTFLMDKVDFAGKITTESGDSYDISGMNRQADGDQLILFTPRYFRDTMTKPQCNEAIIETSDLPAKMNGKITGKVIKIRKGGSPLAPGTVVISGIAISGRFVGDKLAVGKSVTIDLKMTPRETGSWEHVKYCVGGCPWVVKDGKFYMDIEEEHIQPGFYDVDNPRTAVGKTADGKAVIVTVDGRQSLSGGMKCKELGDLMISLGCVEAINLDGGGSTEMAASFGVLDSPSDGNERPTATCLAVYGPTTPAPAQAAGLSISPQMSQIKAGGAAQLTVVDGKGKPLPKKSLDKVVWATNGRIGVVEGSGTFHALKSHDGVIYAQVAGQTLSMPITVLAGELSRIAAFLKDGPQDKPNTSKLSVWVRDANGNPVKWQKVTLILTGGSADKTELATNDDGGAFADITWDGPPAGTQQVEAHCGEVSATAKRIPEGK